MNKQKQQTYHRMLSRDLVKKNSLEPKSPAPKRRVTQKFTRRTIRIDKKARSLHKEFQYPKLQASTYQLDDNLSEQSCTCLDCGGRTKKLKLVAALKRRVPKREVVKMRARLALKPVSQSLIVSSISSPANHRNPYHHQESNALKPSIRNSCKSVGLFKSLTQESHLSKILIRMVSKFIKLDDESLVASSKEIKMPEISFPTQLSPPKIQRMKTEPPLSSTRRYILEKYQCQRIPPLNINFSSQQSTILTTFRKPYSNTSPIKEKYKQKLSKRLLTTYFKPLKPL